MLVYKMPVAIGVGCEFIGAIGHVALDRWSLVVSGYVYVSGEIRVEWFVVALFAVVQIVCRALQFTLPTSCL